ncbi:MAG: hypothetical protein EOO89_23700 [Pedobacter sp.]|nr:MAG: hypothetical protein EOO89_23700 [Pedobacter sp.]
MDLKISRKQILLALLFPLFTTMALGIDSVAFLEHYFDGRQITNLLAFGYALLIYYYSGNKLRKLMLVMVVLSYIGELIFCKLLGMYRYRTPQIPLYVPIGHAIVYASGYILAHSRLAIEWNARLRIIFAIGFVALFLSAGLIFNDVFTLIFGAAFFLLLRRKRWENMYYFIAICVIIIELIGTYFRCWTWSPKLFGHLSTANPPMGAVFFYAGGDVLLAKIVSIWDRKFLKD